MKFISSNNFHCKFFTLEFVFRSVDSPVIALPYNLYQSVVINDLHYYNFILLLNKAIS